ncbi:hypothetical protein OUZ56_011481 [Daphnia magna]|uniref:SAM domain-containing protein n=1 Tax=Daphnia magna TaxID=35525 RepID=A0ABQ9Z0B0_9CRUS|nr:hypothetical protein OUZ56_011481 [Daphnia magna]
MDVTAWSSTEVEHFLITKEFSEDITKVLKENEIDGEYLVLLNNTDVAGFGFKVGPSSKIRFLIESLRQKQASQSSSTADADKSKQDIIVDNGSGSSSDHTPSIPEKHLYAAAIVKEFPCLGNKIQLPQGKMEINHDVSFHPQAGRDGVRKRKPNNKQARSSGSDDIPKRKKQKKGVVAITNPTAIEDKNMINSMYMEKTFEHRQRQSLNTFNYASDVLNEYPRFMDVNNGALIFHLTSFGIFKPNIHTLRTVLSENDLLTNFLLPCCCWQERLEKNSLKRGV